MHAAHCLPRRYCSAYSIVHGGLSGDRILVLICLALDVSIWRQHAVRLAGAQGQGERGLLGADADERRRLRQAEAVERQALQTCLRQ